MQAEMDDTTFITLEAQALPGSFGSLINSFRVIKY